MNMFRHHDGCMQAEAIVVAPQTALQDCIASYSGERLSIVFAESDKQSPARSLVMGQHSAIFVHSSERYARGMHALVWHRIVWLEFVWLEFVWPGHVWLGHSCPRPLILCLCATTCL